MQRSKIFEGKYLFSARDEECRTEIFGEGKYFVSGGEQKLRVRKKRRILFGVGKYLVDRGENIARIANAVQVTI